MKKFVFVVVMLLLTTELIMTLKIQPAHCQPTIYMTPTTMPPPLFPYVGYRWNVTIWITGYQDVYVWRVYLVFNAAVGIRVTGAWIAIFDPLYVFTGRPSQNPGHFIGPGHVEVGDSLVGSVPGENPPPDPAKLAIMEFAIELGPEEGETLETDIAFNQYQTNLLDSALAPIPHILGPPGHYEWTGWSGVAVTDVVPSQSVVGQGHLMEINATVLNAGISNQTFGMIIYSGSLGEPTPEQNETFWSMGDVNRDGYIDDTDLNRILDKFGWIGPPGSILEDINSDGQVDLFDVNITTGNLGLTIWAHFDLALVIDGQTVVDLPPETKRDLTFTWNTTDFATGNYTLTAYAIPNQNETYTADNTFTDGSVIVITAGGVRALWIRTLPVPNWEWTNYTISVDHDCLYDIYGSFNHSLKQVDAYANVSRAGYINLSIPKRLLDGSFKIYVNNTLTLCPVTWTPTQTSWNDTGGYTYIYFTVNKGFYHIKIIGEHLTTFTGDINHDGKVDMKDIGTTAKNFGQTSP